MVAKEKNAAAVALGKRRQQTAPTDIDALHAARDQAARKRTAAERSALARRSAMTRRLNGPAWVKPAPPAPAEVPADLAQLSRAIDTIPDDVLERLAAALAGRIG